MKPRIWLSGSAPTNPSTGWPLSKAMTAGIDWMPSWPAICGCSSMFILTRETLPPASATAFSSAGASCLHGPHHGAQKSTRTGWRVEAVSTSARKEAVVTSLTGLALVSGAVAPLTFAMSHHLQPERRQSPRAPVSHIFLTKWRRSALYSTGGPILSQRRHDRLMAGRPQELDEIGVS